MVRKIFSQEIHWANRLDDIFEELTNAPDFWMLGSIFAIIVVNGNEGITHTATEQ